MFKRDIPTEQLSRKALANLTTCWSPRSYYNWYVGKEIRNNSNNRWRDSAAKRKCQNHRSSLCCFVADRHNFFPFQRGMSLLRFSQIKLQVYPSCIFKTSFSSFEVFSFCTKAKLKNMVYTFRLYIDNHIHHPKAVIPTLSSLFSGNKTQEWFFENNWNMLLYHKKTLRIKIARSDMKTVLSLKNNLKKASPRPYSNHQLSFEFCVKVSDCHYPFQLSLSFQGSF